MNKYRQNGFTLAEVLITLTIIGIVAALTIPNLVENHNKKAWETAKSVFEKRLEVATKQMNTEEKLAGYSNTLDFVNELKNYIKITRVCDNSNITKCFEKEVIWNKDSEPIDMSTITDASALGQDDWNTDTVGVQFANGVNAIIAYNPNASQDPFNNQFAATSESMAIIYDVSGNRNPNTNGSDINHINVQELSGTAGCLMPESVLGFCIVEILGPQNGGYGPMSYGDCNDAVANGEIDVDACYEGDDYYAGAVNACGGKKEYLPTQEQLVKLAEYIYDNDEILADGTTEGLKMDNERASVFLSSSPGGADGWFYVWSDDEYDSTKSYSRRFYPKYTHWGDNGGGLSARQNNARIAACLAK